MNILDKIVGYINPSAGFNRVKARANMEAYENQVRRYEGAAEGRRHSNWLMKTNPSVNQLIAKDHKNLVTRSRELSINNPYARKAPVVIANNVVGTGIIPSPYIVDKIEKGKIVEGKNKEQTLAAVQAAWKAWGEGLTCDHYGVNTFYGLQYLAVRTIVVSGEVLAIRKRVTQDVSKYGLQIQLLEGDYIDRGKKSEKDTDGGYTDNGIKYDKNYKISGYWLFPRHPSEANTESVLVPIEDVVHVFDVERISQNTGVPFGSSTILKQRDLDDYEDAELLGKKTSACMPIFITNSEPEGNKDEERVEDIEPGTIKYLNAGEQMQFAAPPQSNGYNEFTRTQHRAIASGYLMTYEMLTGDLSYVNFSSGRMGAMEFNKTNEYWQYLMFIPRFCDKIFAWFAEGVKIAESLDREIEIKANWTAPRREMIDPLKEITAQRMAVRAGFTTWQNICKENGYKPEDILNEYAEAQEQFKALKLQPEWTAFFERDAILELQKMQIEKSANKDKGGTAKE